MFSLLFTVLFLYTYKQKNSTPDKQNDWIEYQGVEDEIMLFDVLYNTESKNKQPGV